MSRAFVIYAVMAGAGGALWWWVVIATAHIHGSQLLALIAGEALAMTAAKPLEKHLRKNAEKEKSEP